MRKFERRSLETPWHLQASLEGCPVTTIAQVRSGRLRICAWRRLRHAAGAPASLASARTGRSAARSLPTHEESRRPQRNPGPRRGSGGRVRPGSAREPAFQLGPLARARGGRAGGVGAALRDRRPRPRFRLGRRAARTTAALALRAGWSRSRTASTISPTQFREIARSPTHPHSPAGIGWSGARRRSGGFRRTDRSRIRQLAPSRSVRPRSAASARSPSSSNAAVTASSSPPATTSAAPADEPSLAASANTAAVSRSTAPIPASAHSSLLPAPPLRRGHNSTSRPAASLRRARRSSRDPASSARPPSAVLVPSAPSAPVDHDPVAAPPAPGRARAQVPIRIARRTPCAASSATTAAALGPPIPVDCTVSSRPASVDPSSPRDRGRGSPSAASTSAAEPVPSPCRGRAISRTSAAIGAVGRR